MTDPQAAQRELTLAEYVDRLPEGHRARLELAGLREQLQTEREAGLSAYDACGLRGAYWHVVECLARRDEELEQIHERRQPLTVDAATDNAEPAVVRLALLACLRAWEPSARVLGNVRAWDAERAIVDAVDQNAAHERTIQGLAMELATVREERDAWAGECRTRGVELRHREAAYLQATEDRLDGRRLAAERDGLAAILAEIDGALAPLPNRGSYEVVSPDGETSRTMTRAEIIADLIEQLTVPGRLRCPSTGTPRKDCGCPDCARW